MILQRKTVMVTAGAVFILILLAAVAPRLISLNKYKGLIVARLEKGLNRNVKLRNMKLTILGGLGIELQGLQVAAPQGFLKEPFIKVKKCQLKFQLLPLFRGEIRIKKGILDEPKIIIERAQTGQYSINDLLDRKKPERKTKKGMIITPLMSSVGPDHFGSSTPIVPFLPRELKIRRGKVRFIDRKVNQPQTLITTFNNLNLSLKRITGGKVIVVDLSVQSYLLEKSRISIKGEIALPLVPLDLKKTKLDIEIKLNNFNLIPFYPYWESKKVQPFRSIVPPKIYADLQLIGSLDDTLITQGKLEVLYSVSQAKGVDEDLIKLTLQGTTSWDYLKDVLRLEEITFTGEGMGSVRAHGVLKEISKLPYLEMTLASPTFSFSKVISLIYPLPQLVMDGKSSCMLKISGPLNQISLMGSLTLSDNDIKYPRLFQKTSHVPLKVKFNMTIDRDMVEFKRLEVLLDKLNLRGTVGISQFKDPVVRADVDFAPYDLASLATMFPPLVEYKLSGVAEGGFSLDGRIKEPGRIDIDSEIYLKGARITIPQSPLKIKDLEDVTGFIFFAENSLHFKDLSLKAGDSSFTFITAKWERFNHHPEISFDLQGHFLDLDKLIFSDKTTPLSQTPKLAVTGPYQPTDMPTPFKTVEKQRYPSFLYNYNMKGKIRENKIKIQGIYLKDLSTHFVLERGKLAWSDLYARGLDGEIRSMGSIDFNQNRPAYQSTVSLSQLNLISLLDNFTNLRKVLIGRLSSDFKLEGKGFTKESIYQELTGTGNFRIVNGRIVHLNILGNLLKKDVLEVLLRWKKDAAKTTTMSVFQYTDFDDLSGTWKFAKANIILKELIMKSPDLSISTKGIMDLDQSVNFTGTAFLSLEKTNQLLEKKYRPYLTDQRGRLEIPFTILGTIKEPIVIPDILSLSRRGFKAYKKLLKGKEGEQMRNTLEKKTEEIIENLLPSH